MKNPSITSLNGCLLFFLLSVFTVCASAQSAPPFPQTLKILDYNVLEGFDGHNPKNMEAFGRWVDSLKPDIMGLEEMNGFTQSTLESFGQRIGFRYAVLLKESGFPTALLSHFPIADVQKVTDNMTHGFIEARILDYYFIVLHLDPWNTAKKIREINTVIANTTDLLTSNKKVVIMGDFNSLTASDSDYFKKQDLTKSEKILEEVLEVKILKGGKIDYTVCNNMKEAGYTDTWELFHHNTSVNSTPTLKYSPLYPPRAYRIDYIWVNKILAKSCMNAYFIKDSTTNWLSDHYPMILELKAQ